MRFLLQTRDDTFRWGRAFGEMLRAGDVISLRGELGSGKTTLTQAIAAGMGITDPVTSPTFSLIQEYAGRTPLYHFDPYRLDHPEEISELGLDEYLQKNGVVVVEWADLIEPLLPEDRFDIQIEILTSDGSIDHPESSPRSLSIVGLGPRSQWVVIQLVELADIADLLWETEANDA